MKSKDKLLIIGAGGHGRVVADVALRMNKWQQLTFLDNRNDIKTSMGIRVIGQADDDYSKYISDYDIFVAIGNNKIRERIHNQLERAGATIPTLIHPGAIIGEMVEIGIGSVVMAGVVINCCTKIGKGCIVNTGVTIDHDNSISDFIHISPGSHLAGTVTVGKGSWIGIGAIVSNNVSITSTCTIGAGAVVMKDITEPGTYVGIPARRIK